MRAVGVAWVSWHGRCAGRKRDESPLGHANGNANSMTMLLCLVMLALPWHELARLANLKVGDRLNKGDREPSCPSPCSFMWVRMLNWLETDGRTEKSVLFPSGVQLASKWTTPSESALARLEAGWSEAHSALARARLSSASLICKDAVEEGIRG